MSEKETKNKLIALVTEAVAILKEYEPQSDYLAMTYLTDVDNRTIRIYNDAFKKDNIKAIDIWVDNPEIKKREVKDISLDELPELHTTDEFFAMYDECVVQMAQLTGKSELLVWGAMLKQKIKEGFK